VQSNEHFLHIVTPEKTYIPLLPISKFEENIENDVFIRVHRSYIVNRSVISKISKNEVELINGEPIPLGDQYRGQLKRKHITGTLMTRTG
jgi:DNA-binding LytR/AlgR family response regulator